MTIDLTPPAGTRAHARSSISFQMRANVRLFQTSQPLACQEDPDMFFNPRAQHRAIKRCNACPFRGRCGYNAVATGATHGIWGGVILPGAFPQELQPIYARLAKQFEQRRKAELGDLQVAPLPDLVIDDDEADHDPLTFRAPAA